MNTLTKVLLLGAVFVLVAACSENPVAVEDDHDHDPALTVTLTLSEDHLHTLDEVAFTVSVTDDHGAAVTDFESLQVEHRLVGEMDWEVVEMHADAGIFHGTCTFVTSGEYELRVMGMRHGQATLAVLYEEHAPRHIERADIELGDYRVEFESFPGHAHEGEATMIKFWVLHADQPVSGLTAEIHCGDPNGVEETHSAIEQEPGVYHTVHTFGEAGEAHMAIHFTDTNGVEFEADFHMHVDHGHGH